MISKINPIVIIIITTLINIISNTLFNFTFISGDSNYMFASSLSSNGDLIVTSSAYSYNRRRPFYGVKANGKPYFCINGNYSYYLSLTISKSYPFRCESDGGFIIINNVSFFLVSSYLTDTEFYNLNNYSYKLFETKEFLGIKETSARNSIFELKKYPGTYMFCFWSEKIGKMKLIKINFTNDKLELDNGYEIVQSNEVNADNSRIISCIVTHNNYILCL